MDYKNVWLSACFGPASGPQIDVKFKHHGGALDPFPFSALPELCDDPMVEYVIDHDTGEILFSRD